ncbi:MAG: MCE family protein [Chitinophagales bacterium]|nr:MCE family protein [Chitinophagales bacterium]
MKVSNETKVGIFAAVSIVLLILGYNLLKGNPIFSKQDIYYARYERVDGLVVPNHVRVNGMNVGHVQNLQLVRDSSLDIMVTIAVDPVIKIPKGSTAIITSPDLLGTKIVQLEFSKSTDYYNKGDTIPSKVQGGIKESVQAELAPIKAKAENLMNSLDSVVMVVKAVFNDEAKANLQKSIKSIQSTLNNLDQTTAKVNDVMVDNVSRLNKIFANIESLTSNLNKHQDNITALLSNLSAISDSIRRSDITATINNAKQVLLQAGDVIQKINDGQGSMGLLVNNDSLYNNLNASAKSLDALLYDLKANPGRYVRISVFGKKDKPASAPPPAH